ncbi:DinB family protein [Bacillus tianshenii]|uniref:DinB family protein n=1 Tax=Sutcliffiella tianshenii TaxID=1463404 RepID=UPI001CD59155|nr:DinB family protein [Bacillus tianshenii]MCA1321416.1 DinB family protein [Bacillus tianshenii]
MTNEQLLFKQMDFVRSRTLKMMETTSEELADHMPSGFRNSIRWNAGHIFLTQNTLMYSFGGGDHHVPEHYFSLFEMNTSPLDWKSDPPSISELKVRLSIQPDRIRREFSGKLDEKIIRPFQIGDYRLETLAEVLAFANWHEGLHQGVINGLKRASGVENLWEK